MRSLCPDSTLRLVATGCTADVKWSYTLKTTTGTLATTNDTLSLTYNTSLLAAWSAGDTLALTAACTLPNCGASQPSTTVKVVKKQSCATVPAARTASICDIYIKATNAAGQEVSKLTRATGGGFQPVTLSVVGLADTTLLNFPNLTYRWTVSTGQAPPSGGQTGLAGGTTYVASIIGDYKVVIKSGADSCEVFFTLSGTPCVVRDYTNATCQNISINAPAQGNSLSNLAVGDSFNAADYTITVTEVSSSANTWSGKGYVSVLLPMGVTQSVAVTFDNIALNDCYELVNGKIELVVDPNKQLLDVDAVIEDLQSTLIEIYDILKIYDGSSQQKQKIDAFLVELKSQIDNSNLLTPEEKANALNLFNTSNTEWQELKSCNASLPNGRVAADASSCDVSDFENSLNNIQAAAPNIDLPKYIQEGDLMYVANYPDLEAVSPLREWIPIQGSKALMLYTGDKTIKDGLILMQFEKNGKLYTWDDTKKEYLDPNNVELDLAWYYDLLNAGIQVTAPAVDLSVGNGWPQLKKAFAQYKGSGSSLQIVPFVAKMVADGVVQQITDLSQLGTSRGRRAWLGVWMTGSPSLAPVAGGIVQTLTKSLGRYAIKKIGISATELAFVTKLNVEIFRYTINNKLIKPNASFIAALNSNLVPIYRIIDIDVETNGITKKGTFELLKDETGKVFWRLSTAKIITRVLNPVTDAHIIARVKALRQLLTSDYKKSGNFGWAQTWVPNLSKREYFAHSGIQSFTPTLQERVPDISLKPVVEIFPASVELTLDNVPILRNIDTEYKILTEIAVKLGNQTSRGKILLFTERPPCNSCSNVIEIFANRYNIDFEIVHNNGVPLTDF